MPIIHEARCPSSLCGKLYQSGLESVFSWEPPRPAWVEKLKQERDDPTDLIFECPYCKVVWIQPSNFHVGFHAVLKGYDRGNPEQLDPVPDKVRAVDPPVRRIAGGPPKRGGGKR